MARKYPRATVDAIAAGARIEEIDGLPIELRPIPGDSREGVLDPLLLVFTRAYMARVKDPEQDFMYERTRYARETYPFVEGRVERKIQLLDFGDRLIPVHFFKPENFEPGRPVLVFMHGGGFVANRYERYDNAMRYMAYKAGIMVVYPEYRFAPECPFPGPLMDCNATVDWVLEHADELQIDPKRIAIAGDSAGGSLVNGVVVMREGKDIALNIDLYGSVMAREDVMKRWSHDFYTINPEQEMEVVERIDHLARGGGRSMYYPYDESLAYDPRIAAMYAEDKTIFPRTVVVAGEFDYLRVQNEWFAKALLDAGVSVRCIRYLGWDHGFLEGGGWAPVAEDLCDVMCEEICAL